MTCFFMEVCRTEISILIIAEGFEFPHDAQLELTVIVSVCLIKLR